MHLGDEFMKKLFIDTHSEKITIILQIENKVFRKEASSDRSHSEELVPALESILSECSVSLEEIGEIIVVNGPGSFTGVRLGVTVAKTIAYSYDIPIKTITSLEMYGASSTSKFDVVCINDSKGVYYSFKKDEEYSEPYYKKKSDFEELISSGIYKVLEEKEIDFIKIDAYLRDRLALNPHLVNPVYIKEIDVLK